MYNESFVAGMAYIFFFFGSAIMHMRVPPKMTEVTTWWEACLVTLTVAFPFFLGYFAGKGRR